MIDVRYSFGPIVIFQQLPGVSSGWSRIVSLFCLIVLYTWMRPLARAISQVIYPVAVKLASLHAILFFSLEELQVNIWLITPCHLESIND